MAIVRLLTDSRFGAARWRSRRRRRLCCGCDCVPLSAGIPLFSLIFGNEAGAACRFCRKPRKSSRLRHQLHQTLEAKTADRNPLFRAMNSGSKSAVPSHKQWNTADFGGANYVEISLGRAAARTVGSFPCSQSCTLEDSKASLLFLNRSYWSTSAQIREAPNNRHSNSLLQGGAGNLEHPGRVAAFPPS